MLKMFSCSERFSITYRKSPRPEFLLIKLHVYKHFYQTRLADHLLYYGNFCLNRIGEEGPDQADVEEGNFSKPNKEETCS